MGETTARLCMSKLCRGIVECDEISAYYLRSPSKRDARKICNLHKRVHGIDGLLGFLDVTKIHWANCPTAWHGHFKGKEGYPTIGLEAVSDYTLWIWHSAFGFPGAINDINIWERSPLYESMLDGSHNEIDFTFTIDGEQFDELFYMVDGIYPWLSRFLSTIGDPTILIDKYFAKWQEGARKAIERAFGVWKKKFMSVGKSCTLHKRDDIFYLVLATIVMHNMMVEARINEDEVEDEGHYEIGEDNSGSTASSTSNRSSHVAQPTMDNVQRYNAAQRRWAKLYDAQGALRLQDAAKRHVYKQHYGHDSLIETDTFFDGYDPLSY